MIVQCACPESALTTVPFDSCGLLFAKDQRWVIQRSDDQNNAFVDGTNPISEAASWSALPNAIGNTKVVITPILFNVDVAEQSKLEDGENADGAPNLVAQGVQLVVGTIRNPNPDDYAALKKMETCETGRLTLYRIDANGQFMANRLSTSPNSYVGIPISRKTFAVSDPFRGGTKADQNQMTLQFYLAESWFNRVEVIAPEAGFNPLEDIRP